MSSLPTAREALERFRVKTLRPSELLETLLARIERLDGRFEAYVAVDTDGARAQAAEADEAYAQGTAGPLCGLPVSLKDLFALPGVAASCGVASPPRPAGQETAPLVAALRAAGAVILGRVHLHPLAFGLDGENPILGTPQNPRAEAAIPGGSSSGSAVSVAAGLALLSIGTDTGGSVRIPAACCGIVGFKPTHGALDARLAFPVAPSIDHMGLLARGVADCRLAFEALTSTDVSLPAGTPADVSSKVGLLTDLQGRADAAIAACVEQGLGAGPLEHVEVTLGEALGAGKRAYGTLVLAEIAAVHEQHLAEMPQNYDEAARGMVEKGATLRAVDYLRADEARCAFRDAVHELMDREGLAALALPTLGIPVPDLGQGRVEVNGRSRAVAGILVEGTSPFSMIGLPAISLPVGQVKARPVGLQLVARRGDDLRLLSLAQDLEDALGGPAGHAP